MQRITTTDHLFHDGDPFNGIQGTVVTAAFLNGLQEEIAAVIESSGITLDQASNVQLLTALLSMFVPANNTTYAKKSEVQANNYCYGADTGVANVYQVAYIPAITVLTNGMMLEFEAKVTNTGACTFAPNGVAAKPIIGGAHQALQSGEIIAGGKVEVMYHTALASWVLLGCTGGALQVPTATQSLQSVNLAQVQSLASASATPLSQLYFMGQI